MLQTLKKHRFLFEELVKRDFDRKYKGTIFGTVWSILNPLLSLLIMRCVFGHFFGSAIPHYTVYLLCGTVLFNFFSESTTEGMLALVGNAQIFTKVNIPKYLFLLSKNVQILINFLIMLLVFFLFCALDGIVFTWKMLALFYPIALLFLFVFSPFDPKSTDWHTGALICIAIGYNLWFAFAYPMYYTPHAALVSLSTRNSKDRGLLATASNATMLAAMGLAQMILQA